MALHTQQRRHQNALVDRRPAHAPGTRTRRRLVSRHANTLSASQASTVTHQTRRCRFWATVCKTVRPTLSDRCPVCLSVTLVYCGQTVGWIKMKLGMEVGLGPCDIVLDGDPALPPGRERGTAAPSFRPKSIVATVAHLSYC